MQHEQNTLGLLQQQQRIIQINPVQQKFRILAEVQSLNKLQKQVSSYLNDYDQLFRLVSIWLLVRGYDLTNYQPHQVLKAVSLLQCASCEIERMIQIRHQLKKGGSFTVDQVSATDLKHCRYYFMQSLQAYISR